MTHLILPNTQDKKPDDGRSIRAQDPLALNQALGPLFLLTFIFFVHFLSRQVIGPFLPVMEAELGISHAQCGLFILFMGMGFFTSQLSAAYLAGTFGYRVCILLSLWGTAAAMALVGMMHSAWSLYLCFYGLGLSGGLYVPSAIALITVLIRPWDWGKAMGIHELAPNLGLILAPFLATAALAVASWRMGYLGLSLLMVFLGLLFLKHGVKDAKKPSPPTRGNIKQTVVDPSFWVIGILLSLGIGVESGVYTMLPLFLVNERAYELSAANQLLGFSRIPGLIMVLLSGWITDRLNHRIAISLALGLTGITVIFLGLGPRAFVATAIFLQAAASACLFPPILSAASGVSTPENRALTISLSLAVAPVLGGGLIPAGIALAGDLGSFSLGLAAAGALTMAGIALVPFLKRKN
jgi:NNP family nitrate/nitrite transporter-like MFS transporter